MTNKDFYKRVGCVLSVVLFLLLLVICLFAAAVFLLGSNL